MVFGSSLLTKWFSHGSGKAEWLQTAVASAEYRLHQGISISQDLAYHLIRECNQRRDLDLGRRIQSLLIQSELHSVSFFADYLIRLFASSTRIHEANQAFLRVPNPTKYTWNAIINTLVKLGNDVLALQMHDRMHHEATSADIFTFPSILKACGSVGTIEQGRHIHGQIIGIGNQSDLVVGSALVDMYAKCGSLEEAYDMFHKLPSKNEVTWSAMITGYAQHEEGILALGCFENMRSKGIKINKVAFLGALKACCGICAIEQGRFIHEQVLASDLQSDVAVVTSLIDMYLKCGGLEEACGTFDNFPNRNVVTWSVMIAGHAQHSKFSLAFKYFERMQHEGIKPNNVIFSNILKACSGTCAVEKGRWIHELLLVSGLQFDTVLGNTLVDMYAKTGGLEEAERVFCNLRERDVVSWSSMIAGYVQHGEASLAFGCFRNMCFEGIEPDQMTYASLLKACGCILAIEHGRNFHQQIIEGEFQFDCVVGTNLIDMYVKCRRLEEAQNVFYTMPNADVVTWATIVAGYVQNDEALLAIECLKSMQQNAVKPNKLIFSSILKACGSIGAMLSGRHTHVQLIDSGFCSDTALANMLVDMYAKCGSLEESCKTFANLHTKDVSSWGAMLNGYAQLGDADITIQCFQEMEHNDIEPDYMAFNGILTALSRVGLVEDGLWYFKLMEEYYGLQANSFHITCLMDLLGRAACFKEAEDLLNAAIQPDICVWKALLSACKMHCNVALGSQCFDGIIRSDSHCAAAYILMANIYASNAQTSLGLLY